MDATAIETRTDRILVSFGFRDSTGAIALSEVVDERNADYVIRLLSPAAEQTAEVRLSGCTGPVLPRELLWSDGDLLLTRCGDQVSLKAFPAEVGAAPSTFSQEVIDWVASNGGVRGPPPMLHRNAAQDLNLVATANGSILMWPDTCTAIGDAIELTGVTAPATPGEMLALEFWPFRIDEMPDELFAQVWDSEGRRVVAASPALGGPVSFARNDSGPSVGDHMAPAAQGVCMGPTASRLARRSARVRSLNRGEAGWRYRIDGSGLSSSWRLLGRDREAWVFFDEDGKQIVRAVFAPLSESASFLDRKHVNAGVARGLAADRPPECAPGRRSLLYKSNDRLLALISY